MDLGEGSMEKLRACSPDVSIVGAVPDVKEDS